MINEPIDHW